MKIAYNTICFNYKTKEEKSKIMDRLILAHDVCPKSFIDVTDVNNKAIRVICSSKRIQIEGIVKHMGGTSVSSTSVPMFTEKLTIEDMKRLKTAIVG